MAAEKRSDSVRSLNIGGGVTGSALVTGDSNTVEVTFQQASLPQPEAVDIQAELKVLQGILVSLNDPVTTGIAHKLEEEANKHELDKSTVATVLETGLTYAKNLSGFTEAIDKLRPHIESTAGWLGKHGYKLLPLVGLAL